jgi:hypothetical protein
MSFFNVEVLKGKPIKSIKIIPHLRLLKICFWDKKIKKINKNCNSYGLVKIWSNFNNSKVFSY